MASANAIKSTEQLADQSVPPAVQSSAGGIDIPQHEPPRPKRKAVFGLGQNIRNPKTMNPFDYEQKYEEDDYGSELGSNARFWRVLLDEGQAYDAELIEGWRDTLDVLLVFAGLFSAVVTTLVVQSSQALQPDYAAISVSLLAEIVSLQRALADGTPSGGIPRSSLALNSVTATALDYWCNAFWFISLTLSLSAALMSVLIKQWLQAYSSNVSGTPRKQALVRQFRLIGIERWNVPLIVGLLPMLLHLSLLLFFVGLSLYLFTFDTVIASIIAGLAISVYSLYFAANILPMLDSQCPYKTPVSLYGYAAFQASVTATSNFLRQYAHRDAPDVLPSASRRAGASALSEGPSTSRGVSSVNVGTLVRCLSRIRSPASPSRSREADAVALIEDSLTVECLNWVFSTSSNPTVASITVQAVSGLPDRVAPLNNVTMLETLKHDILSCFRRASEDESSALTLMFGQERSVERLARSLLHFVDSGDGFTMRLLTNLKPAILRSRYPANSSISELEGTVMALSTAISRSNEAARAMLFPYLLPVGVPKARLALTDSLVAMKSSLPFVGVTPTFALRLHPVIWHRMLRYLASVTYYPSKSCTLLAVFLWHSAGRAHDYAPPVFERPLTIGASSLYTLCAYDAGYKALVNAAVHRLLCRMSCSHYDQVVSDEDLRLHMLRRALEVYASETLTSSKFHIKRHVVGTTGHFDEVDDMNIGFLARYLDEVPREHAWDLLETVTKIIAWPGLSLQTLHLFFYVYYLQGGQSTTEIPSSSVGPLLRFLAQMLSARPIVNRAEKTHVTVSKIVELMSRTIELHFIEALDSMRDDDIMSALRPLAVACLDNPRAVRLTAALEGLLTAYLQRLVYNTNLDSSCLEAAAARQHMYRLFHACADQTGHLAWYWSIYVLVAATDPHRTSPLRPAMRSLAKLTSERTSEWKETLQQVVREPMPLALGMALMDPRGMSAVEELAGVLSTTSPVGPNLTGVYVCITGDSRRITEVWRCAVNDKSRTSPTPPHAPIILPVSDLVTLSEYNRRWKREYGSG